MHPIRIMVAMADRQTAQQINTLLLGQSHVCISVADSAVDVLAQAEACRPQLAILDIPPDEETGRFETARRLAERYGSHILYVAESADWSLYQRARATSPGILLSKPVDDFSLGQAVDSAIDRLGLTQQQQTCASQLAEFRETARASDDRRSRLEAGRYREQLEAIVMERTLELREANARLRDEMNERIRVQEALRQKEARYRGLIENLPEALLVIQDECIAFANPAAAKLLHTPNHTDLTGKAVANLVLPEFHTVCERCRREALEGLPNRPPTYLQMRCLDGELIEVESLTFAFIFQGVPAVLTVLRDLTDRKRAEAAFQQVQADLKRAQSVGQIGSWRLDVVNNRLTWSDETYRIFGVPPTDAMCYETFLAVVHPDDRERLDQEWQAALQGKAYDIEHRILVDGQVKWIRERAELEFDPPGCLRGGFGTAQDITERKQAEDELRVSEERFRLLFEGAPIGIAVAGLDRRLIRVNQAMCDMLGYSAAELTQKTFTDITHPEDVENNLVLFRQAQQGDIPGYQVVKRYLHRDGLVVWINLTASPIRDLAGKMIYMVGMVENITDRMEAEQHRLTHEASQREALVREVHHRIKNNLQGVVGLLRQQIADQPATREPLEAAIAQIMTISVVHGLQSRLPHNQLSLNALLPEIARSAASLAITGDVAPLHDELHGEVWLDTGSAVTIALVLNELVHNALKHGRHSAGAVSMHLGGNTQRATLRICNPSAGLPAGFDLATGEGLGTGLNLVCTLLPRRGAELGIHYDGAQVCAQIVLTPPVITDLGAPSN